MSTHYDYIIVGGGLSGLSMAIQLEQQHCLTNKTLLILEARQHYKQDKSWSGWHVIDHPFTSCIYKQWRQWSVRYKNSHQLLRSKRYPYQYIRSADFYQYCISKINLNKNITLKLNHRVKEIMDFCVESEGERFSGSQIIDARESQHDLNQLTAKDNYLLQVFYGWHIKVSQPLFNADVATLMDFPEDQTKGINFMYLLPFSSTEALIEPTYFLHHNRLPDKEHFLKLAKEYLIKHYNCENFEIISEEHGILPMRLMAELCATEKIVKIGSSAGLLRPATGYGFYGIQRYVKKIAQQQKKITRKKIRAYSLTSKWMDDVFLAVCRKDPQNAAGIFMRLFTKTSAQRIARFMTDEAGVGDYIAIILSMPKIVFLQVMLQRLLHYLRGKK